MNPVIVLEWTFSPSDYFEDTLEVSGEDYTMTIADGEVEVKIDSAIYEKNPAMWREVQDALNDRYSSARHSDLCSREDSQHRLKDQGGFGLDQWRNHDDSE